ncbi:hypothetical protein J6590_005140 [Homalodisca vitripennis]|nr:hypothetical protein J6590_005140 [Homalodisca vitripennis]
MMELEIPAWLDEEFLKTVLQGGDGNPRVSIIKFTVKPAVAQGDNYSSLIFRSSVVYKTEESDTEHCVSLIIKAPHTKGFAAVFFSSLDVFSKEKKIYTELLPNMCKKLNQQFYPNMFSCPVENVLVFQDLVEEGYILAERREQLDFSHCKLVLSTLAKFHGCSMMIHRENPTLVEALGEEIIYRDDRPLGQQLKSVIDLVFTIPRELLSKMDGCERYAEILSARTGIWESLVEKFQFKPNRLNVLNHGDFWINNMMFKYDSSGNVTEIKLIDYAATRYSSPATDIIYFLWSSANEDVREHRLEELCDIYLVNLNSVLEHLGYERRMSKTELTNELRFFSDWALSLICQFLPIVLTDPLDAINVEDFSLKDIEEGSFKQLEKMYKENKLFLAALPTVLRQYQTWISSL